MKRRAASWLAAALMLPFAPLAVGAPAAGLVIYSTTDTRVFAPVVEDFRRQHAGIEVRYEELDSADLYERYLREERAGRPQADLLLSSSMDLQVKLVNDGHAAPHVSASSRALPAWARWRDEAFGFTFEPAVMVYNRNVMAGRPLPRSRPQLLEALTRDEAFWRGRVGTYDIARSNVGYLLASQDARQSSDFGALLRAFGDAQVRVETRTSTLLDRIASGELAMGYNLLGSYASMRVAAGAPLVIVHPQDYTLAVTRTAVLPRSAPHPDAAHLFLDYLLSPRGQQVLATRSRLPAVRPGPAATGDAVGIDTAQLGLLRPIALGPGLLVYLDRQKRERLLASWREIVRPMPPQGAASP